MKKGKSNWELVIEWFDDDKYNDLPQKDKEILKRFRNITGYITKLNTTIERDKKKVVKLQKEVRERQDKIRRHKNEGKKLYSRVEYLKKKHHIDIYYSEGVQTRYSKRKKKDVQYNISNLKIKSQFTNNIKTISLKPTRRDTINYLKPHFHEWVNSLDMSRVIRSRIYFGRQITEFLRPTIERIFNEYPDELRNGTYKLNLDRLIEEKKLDLNYY
jgi:hypothetical protein